MKAFITSFNQKLGVNPIVGRMLDAIPGLVRVQPEEAEVVFLLFIAPPCDFVLDEALLHRARKRNAPVIIFDYEETFGENFYLGMDAGKRFEGENPYRPLEIYVNSSSVKAYFKRELCYQPPNILYNLRYTTIPIDWTIADQPVPPVDTPEQYEARPIDIFMSWGYSNESRPKLHGELMRKAGKFGAHIVLTEDDLTRALAEGRKRIFALLFTPHYRRIHIGQLFAWQQHSKISISMFGAGKKCFRCAEASYNCVMAQEGPELVKWTYPWVPDNTLESCNCIGLRAGCNESDWVDTLYCILRVHQGRLHPIYLAGMENNRRYQNTAYARDYLLPQIQEALKA